MNSPQERGTLILRAFMFSKIMTSGEWVTLGMLAERLNVSKKTAARWLNAMEAVGFALETVNDTGIRKVFRMMKEQ